MTAKTLIIASLALLSGCTCASYTVKTPPPESAVLVDAHYCSTKEFKKFDIEHGEVKVSIDGATNRLVPQIAGEMTKGAVKGAVGGMAAEILKKKATEALTND